MKSNWCLGAARRLIASAPEGRATAELSSGDMVGVRMGTSRTPKRNGPNSNKHQTLRGS
jgi:hypothetical protein